MVLLQNRPLCRDGLRIDVWSPSRGLNGSLGGGRDGCRWRAFAGGPPSIENREILVGDCVSLTCFCIYKQIASIVIAPDFPGWTAPLAFNPLRFEEFISFAVTVVGTWVATSWAFGNYKINSTVDLTTALSRTSYCWLMAMPVAAAQLILLTAAEDRVLVGAEGFGSLLPLAARGAGEPLVSAAGILGTMLIWRSFYVVYLDFINFRTLDGSRVNRDKDATDFEQTMQALILIGVMSFLGIRAMDFLQNDFML